MLSLKAFTIFAILGLALAQGPAPSNKVPMKIPGTTAGLSGGWSKVKNNDDIKRLINGSISSSNDQGLFLESDPTVQCAFTQVVAGTNAIIILGDADGQAASVQAFQPLPGQNSPDTFTVTAVTPADANAICAEGPTSTALPAPITASAPGAWTQLFDSDPTVQDMLAKVVAQAQAEGIVTDESEFNVNCASSQIVAGKQYFFSIDIDADKDGPDAGDDALLVWVFEPLTGEPEYTFEQVTEEEAQQACASATPPPKPTEPLAGGAPTVSPPNLADAESVGDLAETELTTEGGSVRTAACMVVAPLVLAVAAMMF